MADLYLITGAAGFIGSHIVRRLLEQGKIVRVVDNLSTGKKERLQEFGNAIEFLQTDLAEPAACDQAVEGTHYILHQAAVPSVQRSIRDPIGTNRANVTATLNLLESCRKHRVRRFIYAASSSAYGDTEVLPKSESMTPNPLSPYALQKLVGERYCKLYFDLFNLETVSLRYFNIFGPDQDPYSEYSAVIPKFITRLLAGKPLVVYGDGEQSRDFTYVDNVVEANLLALHAEGAAGQVFNVACGERTSLRRLIQVLEDSLGISATVEYVDPKPGDVRHSLADINLARSVFGYEPRVLMREGIRLTVEAFRAASGTSRFTR